MSEKKYTPEQCLAEIKTIIDISANTTVSFQKLANIHGELIAKLYRMVEFLYHHGTYK